MIASNKERQKHNNLPTIWRAKFKGSHEHSKCLLFVKHLEPKMQTLTRMGTVAIEDYDHMTTMNENMN